MSLVELFGETLLSKTGEVSTKDVMVGKRHVLVYFSAHWCPPCRGFTPQLATAYKGSPAAGKDVVVVFVSSDRDQAGFDDYYKDMPWHALPFSKRDLKESLSQKYQVRGIPTLVVLDGEGNLVTPNGRADYQKYLGEQQGVEQPSVNTSLLELFGETLVSKTGEVSTKDVVVGKKHVMIYFSAHWCPPCRGFTPQLAKAYKGSPMAGKDAVVVFVSSDRDQAGFDDYYQDMPWHALPFAKRDLKESLSQKYQVRGIPTLVVLDGEGNLVTTNGRAEYQKYLGVQGAPEKECCIIS